MTKHRRPILKELATRMAVGHLVDRIMSLSQEDKDDLYELLKELPRGETTEDLYSIGEGMLEILVQAPVTLKRLNQAEEAPPGPG